MHRLLNQCIKIVRMSAILLSLHATAYLGANGHVAFAQDLEAHEATRPDLQVPKKLQNVTIIEKLGTVLPAQKLFFQGSVNGPALSLDKHVNPALPTLLTLNYYQCTALCSLQLNALVDGLKGLDYLPGRDFNLLTISFDARNTAGLAQMKSKNYLESLGKEGAEWKFLVGEQTYIDQVTEAVGFKYRYDPETDQFAHSAAIFFLSPDFKVSRYLYGLQYSPRDLKFALLDASQGKLGSTIEKLILRCFHFDELAGKYTPIAMNSMRVAGIFFSFCLIVLVVTLFRREKVIRREEYAQ